jgi:hypothetical protein
MLGALLAASTAFAEPIRDQVGIYIDPDGFNNCVTGVAPGTDIIPVYVVATNVGAAGGIIGWEMEIDWTGPITDEDYLVNTLNGQYLNFETEPDFSVGLTEALPNVDGTILLVTIEITVDGPDPINFYINGLRFAHSLPERVPAYADGSNPAHILELQQITGGPNYPVFTINGDCAVANEAETWSTVKDLFR